MGLGDRAKELADKAGDLTDAAQEKATVALDRATDATATGVEKVAETLDNMTGGLFEERLAETSGKVAESLRRIGDSSDEET